MDAAEGRNCREVDSFTNEIIIGMLYDHEVLAVEEDCWALGVILSEKSFGGKTKESFSRARSY